MPILKNYVKSLNFTLIKISVFATPIGKIFYIV